MPTCINMAMMRTARAPAREEDNMWETAPQHP